VDTSTHHLSAFGHHVTIGTGFPIYEGGEEGLLPLVNILRFHRSTLASTIQTTFSKVSTDLIPAAPLWLRDMGIVCFVASLCNQCVKFCNVLVNLPFFHANSLSQFVLHSLHFERVGKLSTEGSFDALP
jgi:hypothetical protein